MSTTWYGLAWKQLRTWWQLLLLESLEYGAEECYRLPVPSHVTSTNSAVCSSRLCLRAHVFSVDKSRYENRNAQYLHLEGNISYVYVNDKSLLMTAYWFFFLVDPSFSGSLWSICFLLFKSFIVFFFHLYGMQRSGDYFLESHERWTLSDYSHCCFQVQATSFPLV